MSVVEHLFIHTQRPPEEVADQIATALRMRVFSGRNGGLHLSRPASADGDMQVGGEVARNYLTDTSVPPDQRSLLDAYEIMWDFGYTGRDRETQLREARAAFQELAAAEFWPTVLVAGLDILVAAWDPALGVTWFPADTSPDVDDRPRWEGYAGLLGQ